MTKANVHEAKTNLSKLIEQALNGEEVVIAKDILSAFYGETDESFD
jgi:hypothetical protein